MLNNSYNAAEFLDVVAYEHVARWAMEIEQRPAVRRGRRVNKTWGPEDRPWERGDEQKRAPERHDASDLD